MDVDEHTPATTGYTKVGSTSAGESVPSKRKASNTTSKPRATNGSKAKPPSAQAVVNVDEDDDSETEVATLSKGNSSSSKGKARVPPPASNHLAEPSSLSGTNGHTSADGASNRLRPVSSNNATAAQHARRTDEEWEDILKHVWIYFIQCNYALHAQEICFTNRSQSRHEIGS